MSDDQAGPVVAEHERRSPLWLKLKAYFEARLDKARARNDSSKLGETDTAALRGAIAELKHMARLDQPAPKVEDEPQFKD